MMQSGHLPNRVHGWALEAAYVSIVNPDTALSAALVYAASIENSAPPRGSVLYPGLQFFGCSCAD